MVKFKVGEYVRLMKLDISHRTCRSLNRPLMAREYKGEVGRIIEVSHRWHRPAFHVVFTHKDFGNDKYSFWCFTKELERPSLQEDTNGNYW